MISVIIPTYKRPQLLERALKSVQAQTVQSWEAIVVDDGDGEGTELAFSLRDARIRAYPNWGSRQTDARNTALLRAECDYIALLDDDDWWEDPQHLEHCLEVLRTQNALVYRGGYLVTERNMQELERLSYTLEATPQSLLSDNALLVSAVAYPRAFHDELGGFDDRMGHYWDWDWYLRVAHAGYGLVKVEGSGVCIALHESNASGAHQNLLERRSDLSRLSQKHGLEGIELKNHHSLLLEGEPTAYSGV